MSLVRVLLGSLVATLLLLGAASARAADDRVSRISVHVPPGEDLAAAFRLVQDDQGAHLDEALVDRHVEALGRLGWVDTVDVDVRPASLPGAYELRYRLLPRDQVREVRVQGSHSLSAGSLTGLLRSRPGETFNLRRALDDAHQINLAYQDAGFAFSGVLDARQVLFEDGVLTFRVAESYLEDGDRRTVERLLGRPLDPGALTRRDLARMMASGDAEELFRIGELRLDVDRLRGELHLSQASD